MPQLQYATADKDGYIFSKDELKSMIQENSKWLTHKQIYPAAQKDGYVTLEYDPTRPIDKSTIHCYTLPKWANAFFIPFIARTKE